MNQKVFNTARIVLPEHAFNEMTFWEMIDALALYREFQEKMLTSAMSNVLSKVGF